MLKKCANVCLDTQMVNLATACYRDANIKIIETREITNLSSRALENGVEGRALLINPQKKRQIFQKFHLKMSKISVKNVL